MDIDKETKRLIDSVRDVAADIECGRRIQPRAAYYINQICRNYEALLNEVNDG